MRRLLIVFITCVFLVSGCDIGGTLDSDFNEIKTSNDTQKTIVFGRVPSETVIKLLRDYAPLIKHLENQLDVNIQVKFDQSYEAIIEKMKRNKYDLALLGPYSYILAKDQTDYKAIVQPIRFGKDFYRGIIFSRTDVGIKSIEDLRGRSIAFVDRESTSGYLFPKALLIEAGLPLNRDTFSRIGFEGRHDAVVRTVYNGKYTAGASFEGATQTALPESADSDELTVIDRTRKIPTEPLAISQSFRKENPELVGNLTDILTNLHKSKQGKTILDQLGLDRYQRVEAGEYESIRTVVELIEQSQ